MSVKNITTNDLRRMKNSEGLIIQGCGGDLQEWVDGINDMLTNTGILLHGTRFTDVSVFEHNGLTNILFPFSEDVHLNVGKLAMWRLSTHETFGGTWLSDYVENNLGGFAPEKTHETFGGTWLSDYVENNLGGFAPEKTKPDCALIGENSNIFHLAGKAAQTLKQNGMRMEAREMLDKVMSSGSYDEALGVIGDYVSITDGSESEDFDEGQGMSL